jgi:ATP-dependent Clp protease adaptor protein ClpS
MEIKTFPWHRTSSFVVEPWNVVLLNDDWHTFEEVASQVAKATGHTMEKSMAIALKAHSDGEAVCFTGAKEHCENVAMVLEEIDLGVRIVP